MLKNFTKSFSAVKSTTDTTSDITYERTAMVRHQGQVIALAMDNQRRIFYTVLALTQEPGQAESGSQQGDAAAATNGPQGNATAGGQSAPRPIDAENWQNPQELMFPAELSRVGYGAADQFMLPVFKGTNPDSEDPGTRLPDSNIGRNEEFNYFRSTTAWLTADAPFQVMSDGQYVYIFRQAIDRSDGANKLTVTKVVKDQEQKDRLIFENVKDQNGKDVPLVDATLLVDRFVLSGTQLKHKLEVRYQRSRSKTRPANRKDGLGSKDLDGNSFYEPTQELKFVRNLTDGQFTVLLLPTQIAEIQRWQIFASNSKTGLIDSFNVERSPDGLFNTRGSQVYTCPDHDQVYSLKAGNCVEPSVNDPTETCGKELIPRVSTQGYAESALKFDGNGYVALSEEGISLGKSGFTQEIWFYLPDASSPQPQLLIGGAANLAAKDRPPSIWIEEGKNLRVGFGDGTEGYEFDVENVLAPAAWHHIAVTFNGKAYRIYVDGKLRLVTDQDALVKDKSAAKNSVQCFGTETQLLHGTIDEIRLWNRARSQTELRSSMNQRLTGQEPGLVGYWRFDEAEGSTVYDQTDNRANGTINNGTWVASDAPVGESLGINRTSFQVVTRKDDGTLESRRVASGLTALLYYQQENAPSGYSGEEKPLKMGARVMLAMATESTPKHEGDKPYIATIDFGVSASGQIAQVPDVITLSFLEEETATQEEKTSAPMNLLYTDPYGLSISGGLLGFAWTEKAPFLFDSATGKLALYFQGKDNQFFATYYETQTERAKYPLSDQFQKHCVTGIANSTELEMDSLVITVEDGETDSTCIVTIERADITETWRNVPRDPEKFAKVINGEAGNRRYIGSGLIETNNQGTTLELAKGVKRPLTQTETLIVGTTRVTVAAETVALETTSFAITTHDEARPTELLPVYWVEYDYATLAETTKVPADLYNGSLLIKAIIAPGNTSPTAQVINQNSTSGSTFYSKWVAAKPGSTLNFDESFARFSPTADLNKFEAVSDLTLETWFKAKQIVSDRAQIIQYYQSNSVNYFISLEKQTLGSALRFDGTSNYIEIANPSKLNDQSFTLEAWIKPAKTDRRMQIISFGSSEANQGLWFFVNAAGKVQFDLSYTAGPSSSQRVDDGAWHHVAVVNNNNQIQIYVDGIASGSGRVMRPALSTAEFMIGQGLTGHNYYFQGEIAEVRIWNQSRTQPTIQAERNRPLVGNEPDLVGYWRFEAGNAIDYSRNQKNGALQEFSVTPTLTSTADISSSDYYQIFIGVNNQLVRSSAFYTCGSWTHLATVFKQSYGVEFDAKGAYLDCGNDRSLNITDDLTIEMSLKIDALGTPQILLGRGESKTAKNNGVPYSLGIDQSRCLTFKFDNVDGHSYERKSTQPITTAFCKIAVTRKRNQRTEDKIEGEQIVGATVIVWYDITFYINGEKVGEFKYESAALAKDNVQKPAGIAGSDRPLHIGKAAVPGGYSPFKGIISEVRLWNVARESHNIGTAPTEDGLISWWRFEESQGNTAYDSKGANHAKIKDGKLEWVKNPDPNASPMTLYLNGDAIAVEPVPDSEKPTFRTTHKQFTLGAFATGANAQQDFFQGELEELRIWKTARTQEQIQDNLFRRLTGEQENLIAYYTFDVDQQNQVTDHSFHGNHLAVTEPIYALSTAPIGEDIPQVRSALAGVKTTFNDSIESTPAVQEYGDLQFDSARNMIGVFKRCYSFIKDKQWHLITGFKVGDLVSEWIGQVQFAPQLIGYIEGAPPVPSENLTGTGYVHGEFADYTGASSVELTQAKSTTYTYATSKEDGFDLESEFKIGWGGEVEIDLNAGIISPRILEIDAVGGLNTKFEHSHSWLNEVTTGFGLTTTGTTRMELRGIVENEDAVAYPKVGRRFVPDNMGMALVKSQTADVFALRLKHNSALVSFQMRPNPDIPPDWNIITFPMNPRYVKQGSLDGKIGFEPDPDYPNALEYSPDSSYFKPLEAYALKNRIDREAVELETEYNQFDAIGRGQRRAATHFTDNENAQNLRAGFPNVQKRNLVNTYVWTSAGGLFAETQETIDVTQEVVGGSYSFKGVVGGQYEAEFVFSGVKTKSEANLLFGGHLNLAVTKTKESQTAFGLNVDIGQVESDAYLRDADGNLIMDKSAAVDPTDPLSIRKWKPRLMPGRVDAYRFMTLYLEPQSDHFDLFFNQVVDPIWLNQSNEPNALALLQAQQTGKKPACWRIMHRVTFVSRVLPEFDEPTATPLEKALKSLDIESNYELIQQLSPYVQDALNTMGEFVIAVDKTLNEHLPELQPHREEIIRYLSLYYGVGDPVEAAAEEVQEERRTNKPPIVVAQAKAKSADQTNPETLFIHKEDGVELDGIVEDDRLSNEVEADGTSIAIFTTWSKVKGEGDVTFANVHAPKTQATFSQRGQYVLRLTADDGYLSASDDIAIVVNEVPKISAGPDQNLRPGSVEKLREQLEDGERETLEWLNDKAGENADLSATQLRGLILDDGLGNPQTPNQITVEWEKVGGNGTVNFQDKTSLNPLVTFEKSGFYLLQLAVDNGTTQVTDQIMVSVAARVIDQLQVLYTFEEGAGNEVKDVSGVGIPLNLNIANPDAVTWDTHKLTLTKAGLLSFGGDAGQEKVAKAVKASGEITVEAWIQPTGTQSEGLARMITLSAGPAARNFTLGQSGDYYYFALRTENTDDNATQTAFLVSNQKIEDYEQKAHLVCTRDREGLTQIYLNGDWVGSYSNPGSLSNWAEDYGLALGNELNSEADSDRAWLGSYHLVAIYSRALSPEDVKQNYDVGSDADLPSMLSMEVLPSSDTAHSTPHIQHQPAVDGTNDTWFVSKPELPVTVTLKAIAIDDRPSTAPTVAAWSWVSAPVAVVLPANGQQEGDITLTRKGTYVLRLTYDDGSFTISKDVALVINHQPILTFDSPQRGEDDAKLHVNYPDLPLTLTAKLADTGLGELATASPSMQWTAKDADGNTLEDLTFTPSDALSTQLHLVSDSQLNTYATPAELHLEVNNGYLANVLTVPVCIHKTPEIAVKAQTHSANPADLPLYGANQFIATLPHDLEAAATMQLVGTIAQSGLGDRAGAVTTTWRQVSGPTAKPVDEEQLTSTMTQQSGDHTCAFTVDSGVYTFEFTVDNGHLSHRQAIKVIANRPPQLRILPIAPKQMNQAIILEAIASDDGLPAPANLQLTWRVDKSPPNAEVDITNPNVAYTQATFSRPGEYTLALQANDGHDTTEATADVTVPRPPRIRENLIALYTFKPGSNRNVVPDVSDVGTAVDLQIPANAAVRWVSQGVDNDTNADQIGGLVIEGSTLIKSSTAATKIIDAVKASNALTVEAWIKPRNVSGNLNNLARIVTLSKNAGSRNFTLFQGIYQSPQSDQNEYGLRLRTTATDPNGIKADVSPLTTGERPTKDLVHLVFTRTATGDAVLYVNGVAKARGTIGGNFSEWDGDHRLAISDELDGNRGWLGQYCLIALYDRALTQDEVLVNFHSQLSDR